MTSSARHPAAFISYSTADKGYGSAVKAVLKELSVESFLAHDDLHVSETWERRILSELAHCNIFIPLLSKHFVASEWCSQECGVAIKKRALEVVPLSIDGTMPYGFLRKVQAMRVKIGDINVGLFIQPLAKRFPRFVMPQLIERLRKVYTFRTAEVAIAEIQPYFGKLTIAEANRFAERCIENDQIWAARLCRDEYLPLFLRARGDDIRRRTRQRLRYQVVKQRRFPAKSESK